MELPVARQIEPGHAAALGLAFGEGRQAARHCLLHQRDQLPGHRAPRRRDGGRRAGLGRVPEVDFHERCLEEHVKIPEVPDLGFHVGDPHGGEPLAEERGGAPDFPVLVAPASGEGVRVDDVGDTHLGPVVELREHHAVGDPLRRDGARRPRPERARPRLGHERARRHLDGSDALHDTYAIRHPAVAGGRRQHSRVGERRPHEPARRVPEAADRVPGRGRP